MSSIKSLLVGMATGATLTALCFAAKGPSLDDKELAMMRDNLDTEAWRVESCRFVNSPTRDENYLLELCTAYPDTTRVVRASLYFDGARRSGDSLVVYPVDTVWVRPDERAYNKVVQQMNETKTQLFDSLLHEAYNTPPGNPLF